MRKEDSYEAPVMQEYYRDKLLHEKKDLEMEEDRLRNYLKENSNSLSNDKIEEINNRLTGLNSMKGEIDQILTGGFY